MEATYQVGRGGELDANSSNLRVNPEKEKAFEEINKEQNPGSVKDDSIGMHLKRVSFDQIQEEDMPLFISGSNRSYKELPGSCTGYFIMTLVVYISTGYFTEVTKPQDYYAQIIRQDSFFSTGLGHVKEYINGRWSSRKKVNIYNDDGTIQSFDDDPPPSPSSPNISTPTAKPGLKKISTMARLDPFNLFSARISTTSVDLDDGQKGWDKKVQDVRDLRDRLRENDESLEDDEIYEQLEFERSNPIGGFIQYWLSQMVQGIANILLSVLMPTILTSLFWTGIIVGAPMSLLFADYLSLKSIPVCAYQMCKAALPALVGYFVSGVTLYYLYLNFIATLEDGICVQYNDDKFQSSMIMVFFASVVPGFPELWTQLMIALYADTFLYKSKGVFYRVKVPNDITFRLRVCFFPVIDLGIFAWLLMAGTLYVLASSDPTSLVQAGCAIIFVAEIDKMYFNAYVRGEDQELMGRIYYEYPFFDEPRHVISRKMEAVNDAVRTLKSRREATADPQQKRFLSAKIARKYQTRLSLFMSNLSSLAVLGSLILLNIPVYPLLLWFKYLYDGGYCNNIVESPTMPTSTDDASSSMMPP